MWQGWIELHVHVICLGWDVDEHLCTAAKLLGVGRKLKMWKIQVHKVSRSPLMVKLFYFTDLCSLVVTHLTVLFLCKLWQSEKKMHVSEQLECVLSFLTVSWQPTSRSLVLSDKPINTQMLGAYCYKLNTLPSVVFLNKNLYDFGLWCTWTNHMHPSDQLMAHLKLNNSHWRMPLHWQSRFTEESIKKLPFTDINHVIGFSTPLTSTL